MVVRFPVFRFPQCSVILNGGVKVCTYPLCTGLSVRETLSQSSQNLPFLYNHLTRVLHLDPVSVVGKNIHNDSSSVPYSHGDNVANL